MDELKDRIKELSTFFEGRDPRYITTVEYIAWQNKVLECQYELVLFMIDQK